MRALSIEKYGTFSLSVYASRCNCTVYTQAYLRWE